jgi:hypothetical protein
MLPVHQVFVVRYSFISSGGESDVRLPLAEIFTERQSVGAQSTRQALAATVLSVDIPQWQSLGQNRDDT